LEFLSDKAAYGGTQYILTINADRLMPGVKGGEFIVREYIRARFTKHRRFLRKIYQETKANQ
jgi:hypothetical protein